MMNLTAWSTIVTVEEKRLKEHMTLLAAWLYAYMQNKERRMKVENEKKNAKPGNKDSNSKKERRNDRKVNAAIDPTRRRVPNAYGIRIILTNKNNIPDSMLREMKQHPAQHDFPFYVLKRFYMKTISNMINDIVDIIVYRGNYSFFETDGVTTIDADTSREGVLLYMFGGDKKLLKDYKIFNAASDRRTHGIRYNYRNQNENKYTLTCEGELVTWDAERIEEDNIGIDNEYTIIEKEKLESVVNWFDRLIEFSSPSIHQFAAISYLEGVVEGKYFYNKPVFGYSVKR